MKKLKFSAIVSYILLVGLLVGMMLCAAGCKKKPTGDPTGTQDTTMDTAGGTETEDTLYQEETQQLQQQESENTEETGGENEATGETESLSNCNHVPGNWIVDKSSTCTTEGSRHRICTLCHATIDEEDIPTIDHTPGAWISDRTATCSVEGMRHQSCTQCKAVLVYIATAKAPHDEYTVSGHGATAIATGLTDGKKCRRCGEITQPQYIIPLSGEGGFAYFVNKNNTCSVISLNKAGEGTVSVPSAIAGYTVTGIGNGAFENAAGISEIILPASVTSIGERAFAGCAGLTTVVYEGSTSQWAAIEKGLDWNKNAGSFSVSCTKG